MKNIYLLGANGSIGSQALEVIKENNMFKIIGLSLSYDNTANIKIIDAFQPLIVCLRDDKEIKKYQQLFPNTKFVFGDEGLIKIVEYHIPGLVINALSGSAGLMPTYKAILNNKDVALANKETLVMAGDIIMKLSCLHNTNIIPVDSEHSAIWQTISNRRNIKKIVLTASGGALRNKSRKELKNISKEDALKHPNWNMGPKVTIDSATMMNKSLEVIEAHHLFNIAYDNIDVYIHEESIVHGMTYYSDGAVLAHLSKTNMKYPIAYALYYPDNYQDKDDVSLFADNLSFKKVDYERFPFLELGYRVGRLGGLLPAVMNSANEAAVKLFLDDKITFLDIESIVFSAVNDCVNEFNPSLERIIEVDKNIKESIYNKYR